MIAFEDYLIEIHAEQYIGTKDCMIDDFNKWMQDLGADELINYGDEFFKKQNKELLEILKNIIEYKPLAEYIPIAILKKARKLVLG